MTYRIGIDIGATKIAFGVLNAQAELIYQEKQPTITTDSEALFEQLVQGIDQLLRHCQLNQEAIEWLGIGIPGKVDRIKGIAIYQMLLPWRDFPIVQRLSALYDITIYIDNDVAVAALAEYVHARCADQGVFSYITISTGISSQTFVKGQLIRGNGLAGEIALVPVDPHEPNRRVQHVASGSGIQASASALFGNQELKTADVFAMAKRGDERAIVLLDEAALVMAWSISQLIAVYDPDWIVMGGSVMLQQASYFDQIKLALETLLIPEQSAIIDRISRSRLHGNNGILGAAYLGEYHHASR